MTVWGVTFLVRRYTTCTMCRKALKENPTRFSTTYIGVWGIPKRFKGVKGWVSGIGYEGKSQSHSSCPWIKENNYIGKNIVVGHRPTK